MTNTPDPTAVRDSLARWREFNRRCDGGESPVTAEAVLHNDDMAVLCFAYDAEHDPTPLTVEVLVGRGFEITDSPRRAVRGPLSCNLACLDWIITHPGSTRSRDVYPPPRTAGHLAMLLAMMEGR